MRISQFLLDEHPGHSCIFAGRLYVSVYEDQIKGSIHINIQTFVRRFGGCIARTVHNRLDRMEVLYRSPRNGFEQTMFMTLHTATFQGIVIAFR